ncbi:MAG: recombination protein RecR [Spirochaetes bacterium]|nr:recombination protein RecR [Spirochaetota bacterium]MBN2770381.1 recombination protein RecR [Spirochaetota bacterium]
MHSPSEYLEALIQELGKLPGIGSKSASRAAFHILEMNETSVNRLLGTITALRDNVRECTICGGISDTDICSICSNTARNRRIICVVEDKKSVLTIEKTGTFNGLYHILGGVISPLDGIGPENIRFSELRRRCESEDIEEVIMATNPTIEGDATVLYCVKLLKPLNIKVMRLARGLPVGADIDFTDIATISKSMSERHEV